MPRKLIIGPAGTGKTHRLLGEFEDALKTSDPLSDDFFFLVPSAEHTDRVISLLLQRGIGGFFHRRVTTLSDLTARIFGIPDENVISSTTRYGFVREILEKNPFEYFSEVQNTPGFLNLTVSFLQELKESRIPETLFRSRMNHLKTLEPDLASKYEALARIYELYQEMMKARGFLDRQDLLSIYRSRKTPPKMQFKKIWLDGFFDFSNLQLEYLNELARISEEITVTLTQDGSGPAKTGRSRSALFEALQPTAQALTALDFKTEEIAASCKRTESPELLYLEKYLFSETKRPAAPPSQGDIRFFEAVGIQGEIEMIARHILRLYREKNFRFSDFAVLLRQVGGYESVIRSVFSHYGIPVEVHERERVKRAPFFQPILRLFKIFSNGWEREDLTAFLKSSYVRAPVKDYEWVSEFENRAYQEAVSKDKAEWLRFWGNSANPEDVLFHEKKLTALHPLAELEEAFRLAASMNEMTRLLMEAVKDTFSILKLADSYEEPVRRDAASMKRLEALLEEIRLQYRMKGIEKPALAEFAEDFLRLAELDLYSLHEKNTNRVQVYDISLARQKEYRVVFIAGLLEKSFPVHVKEDPLLSDWERRLIRRDAESHLAEKLPRQHLERYLFYLAVTRASEQLILSCPRLDLEGKQSLPSFYLEEVKTLFPNSLPILKQDLAHPYPDFEEAASVGEFQRALVGGLWDSTLDSEEQKRLLYFWSRAFQGESWSPAENIAYEVREKILDPRILERDAFRSRKTSSSRLEDYAKCPFKYFAGNVLKLKDPREEVNFKLQGSILHDVLENYFKARKTRRELHNFDESLAFLMSALDDARKKYPLVGEKKYRLDITGEQLRETLRRYLDKEWEAMETSLLQPQHLEFSFGTQDHPDAPALEIKDGERSISITGRIDRIDVDPSGKYGLVLDYKRSAKLKRENIEMGTSLQLAIYLMAAREFLGLEPVGGAFYSLKDLKAAGFYHETHAGAFLDVSSRSKIPPPEFERILKQSADYIRRFTLAMSQGEMPVTPRDPQICDFCSYAALCRIQKWRVPLIVKEIRDEERKRRGAEVPL